MQIRLSKSSIGKAEKDAVLGVLDREYLGMGKEVQEFESMLTNFFQRPVSCVNSGTAALHLALQALGLGWDDEVLVQSFTFVATYQAISATGAKPVSCDVTPNDICIDLKDAEMRLTSRTRAIMPVHYASSPGRLDEIYAFAKANGLRVVEDAAHAFGSEYRGQKIGSFGDITCFSFDGIKNITSGEGGAVVTNDPLILERVNDARLLGVEKDTEKRYKGLRSWEFDASHQGWRYHMSNIMAAIGCEQMKRFGAVVEKRRSVAKRYTKLLGGIRGVEPLFQEYGAIVPHIFVVKVKPGQRDGLRTFLIENGIECAVHYYPNHFLARYRTQYQLPETEKTYARILSLPCHMDLSVSDQEFICKKISEFFK